LAPDPPAGWADLPGKRPGPQNLGRPLAPTWPVAWGRKRAAPPPGQGTTKFGGGLPFVGQGGRKMGWPACAAGNHGGLWDLGGGDFLVSSQTSSGKGGRGPLAPIGRGWGDRAKGPRGRGGGWARPAGPGKAKEKKQIRVPRGGPMGADGAPGRAGPLIWGPPRAHSRAVFLGPCGRSLKNMANTGGVNRGNSGWPLGQPTAEGKTPRGGALPVRGPGIATPGGGPKKVASGGDGGRESGRGRAGGS